MNPRRGLAFGLLVLGAAACTGGATSEPATGASDREKCEPGPGCVVDVTSAGIDYLLECRPVAEALIDVDLPHDGSRPVKAIAGVSSTQGVAAMWRDPEGCGLWVLALADGLAPGTADAIREEMDRGVERFGVTASPVPKDVGEG